MNCNGNIATHSVMYAVDVYRPKKIEEDQFEITDYLESVFISASNAASQLPPLIRYPDWSASYCIRSLQPVWVFNQGPAELAPEKRIRVHTFQRLGKLREGATQQLISTISNQLWHLDRVVYQSCQHQFILPSQSGFFFICWHVRATAMILLKPRSVCQTQFAPLNKSSEHKRGEGMIQYLERGQNWNLNTAASPVKRHVFSCHVILRESFFVLTEALFSALKKKL